MTAEAREAGTREWAGLGVLTLAVCLLAIDGTVLALAVPALSADLAPTSTQLLWIGDIYSFALGGLLITMGNVADRIGRKRLLLIGAVGFGLSSALAAFSPNAEALIAARALLGISGATIMPSTLSLVRNIFHVPRQRTTAIAVWSAGAMGGAALGPLVGGALLENFWWGSVFLINLPVVLVIIVAGAKLLPESRAAESYPVDLASAALSVGAIVPIVYAIKVAVHGSFGWTALAVLLTGAICGRVFLHRQQRLAHPLIDLTLFRIPAFSGALAANGIAIFAFSGMLFFFSQYLQLVLGFGPLKAGLAELPTTIASILVITVVAVLVRRAGQGRSIGIGMFGAAAGLVLLAVGEAKGGYAWLAVGLVLIGAGIGVAMTVSTDAVVSAAPPERAGAAASVAETAYELGLALGIAILGSAHAAIYRANLDLPAGLDEDVRTAFDDSLASGSALADGSGSAAMNDALSGAQHAFAVAMQMSSVLAAGLVVLAGVLAWRLIPFGTSASEASPHVPEQPGATLSGD